MSQPAPPIEDSLVAMMNRSFAKALLGPEWRQPNGAPPAWIPDSPNIIMDDVHRALDKAIGTADPR